MAPYVYFGFDWENDVGNVEGGFQFIEDENNLDYNKWTVFMRQGDTWAWGNRIALEQGSTHNLKFYIETLASGKVDLIIELDGREVVRKPSSVSDFSHTSAKMVSSIAMTKTFDGSNCFSKSINSKVSNIKVSTYSSDQYFDFTNFSLYTLWKPNVGANGTLFGTVECIPSYLHYGADGFLSIYK